MATPDSAAVALIESRILLIRGQKMLLDQDLARLYQVKPIALRQQVRRNSQRFPPDFLFELTEEEVALLLSQNVIPSLLSLGGAKPLAFTEQGIAKLSSVLTSKRAIKVNIAIMRTFVHLLTPAREFGNGGKTNRARNFRRSLKRSSSSSKRRPKTTSAAVPSDFRRVKRSLC